MEWLGAMIGAVGARFVHAARWSPPEIAAREITIEDLGEELDGYTVVALSDFHHPPTLDARWVGELIDTVNALSPDLIALLGDYGTSFKHLPATSRAWYRTAMRAMAPACARLDAPDGVVAVLGNHDYYAGADEVRDWLHGFGADVLVNYLSTERSEHYLLSSKLFEYLATRCPVIEVNPTVPDRQLLRRLPDVVVLKHPTLEELKEALARVTAWSADPCAPVLTERPDLQAALDALGQFVKDG